MPTLKNLFRTAIAVVLFLAIASLLTHNPLKADLLKKSTAPAQGFYLTTDNHQGNAALSACAAGYHMASLWEIHEPSNLSYNTTLGQTFPDSGSGPPSNLFGWIRTGWVSQGGTTFGPAFVNCNAWTSNASTDAGSTVALEIDWVNTTSTFNAVIPWTGQAQTCDQLQQVWCVQD